MHAVGVAETFEVPTGLLKEMVCFEAARTDQDDEIIDGLAGEVDSQRLGGAPHRSASGTPIDESRWVWRQVSNPALIWA